MLRTESISWEATLAAIERLRFWRVKLSEELIPTATPLMTMPKIRMAASISTMLKPSSP